MRLLPFRVLLLIAAMLGCPLLRGYAADERKLTGREAEAIALAINEFKTEHRQSPKYFDDLKDHTVTWHYEGNQLWVAFARNPRPKPKLPKGQYWLEFGGGWYYVIALDRMKILKIIPMK